MKLKRIVYILFIGFQIFFFSCTGEGIVEDFGDMAKLRDSLIKVYPDEDIQVKISNGYFAQVAFINSEMKNLNRKKKEKIAKKIGSVTRFFFKKDRITEGSLSFITYKNYIIFRYTNALDNYDLIFPENSQNDSISDINSKKKTINNEFQIIRVNKKINSSFIYRIQILATKTPIKNINKEFKNIKYRVNLIVIDKGKYKYKYTVGKYYSLGKTKLILAKIQNSGFSNAFIIKTQADL